MTMNRTKRIWLPLGIVASNELMDVNREQSSLYAPCKWNPHCDLYETENGLMLIMDIAGVTKDEVKVVVQNNVLSISGTRSEPEVSHKKYIHCLEIDYGTFEKRFILPETIDTDNVDARYENGFLYLVLPLRKDFPTKILP